MNAFPGSQFQDDDAPLGVSRVEQAAWRGVSVLLVLTFALQVGLGYARSDAAFRDSLARPTFVRALAQSLTTTAARPTRNIREVPARQASMARPVSLDARVIVVAVSEAVPTRMPRHELISLPPPRA